MQLSSYDSITTENITHEEVPDNAADYYYAAELGFLDKILNLPDEILTLFRTADIDDDVIDNFCLKELSVGSDCTEEEFYIEMLRVLLHKQKEKNMRTKPETVTIKSNNVVIFETDDQDIISAMKKINRTSRNHTGRY